MNTTISLLFISSSSSLINAARRCFRVWSGFLINNSESFQSVLLLYFHMDTPSGRSPTSSDFKIRGLVPSSEEQSAHHIKRLQRLIQRIHTSVSHICVYMYIYEWYKCTSCEGLIQQFFQCREPQKKKKKASLLGCPELFIPAQHMKRLLTPQRSNRPMWGSSVRRRGLRAPIESGNDCEGKYSLFHCWPMTHTRGTVWKHTAKKIG